MQTSNASAFQLGTAVMGAVIGSFAGNPLMGFQIGMMAGSFLFLPKAKDANNVIKASDLQMPRCETGIPIPVMYGAFGPVSGNVVYFGNKVKHTHVQETEGKGGAGGQKTIYYTYTADFAMVIGWGPGTVLRAYAGGRELEMDSFRIYDGTQTDPDPIFNALPRKPVWKGLILICAEQYDFGTAGQFPMFEFDVARKKAVDPAGTGYWAGETIPVAGGIDIYGDDLYLAGGASETAPLITIYDPWIRRDDTVPGTIPAAAKSIAVSPERAFLVEWADSPLIVYVYGRSDMAYQTAIDLTGTANRIFAIACDQQKLYVIYNNISNAVRIRRYNCSDLSLEATFTITGISTGRVIADLAVDPDYYYLADTANAKVWQIPRATLSATARTIPSGTPSGVAVDNLGRIWAAGGGAAVYVYAQDWTLLATVSGAGITAAASVRLFSVRHRLAVLNMSGDSGSIAVLSAGELTQDVVPGFSFERSWRLAPATTDITRLAAGEALLAAIEKPSDDIYVYSHTGDHINTIAGTWIDVTVNGTGVYGVPDGSSISFYAGGTGAADTRNVGSDVTGAGGTFTACMFAAAGKDMINGNLKFYVLYRAGAQRKIAEYTLSSDGKVSTADFEGIIDTKGAGAVEDLEASPDGYGLLMLRGAVVWHYDQTWQKAKSRVRPYLSLAWLPDASRYVSCEADSVIFHGQSGTPEKTHNDASRMTALRAVAYFGGRIFAADKLAAAGQSRILVYIDESHPASTAGPWLPADIAHDMLADMSYGAGIDPDLIDAEPGRLVNSYAARHGLELAPYYTTQMPATDFLEEICAHHNGFVRVAEGKIAHSQFYYDPFDEDCAFTEITDKSDGFSEAGVLGEQWEIVGPVGPNLIQNGGFEEGVEGWTPINATLASISGGVYGKCLELTMTDGSVQVAAQIFSSLTPGNIYMMAAYAKSGTSGDVAFGLYLQEDGVGNRYNIDGITEGDWVKHRLTFTVADIINKIILIKGTASPGTMLFDEVSLQEIPDITIPGGKLTISRDGSEQVNIGLIHADQTYGAFDIRIDFMDFSATIPSDGQYAWAGLKFIIDDDNWVQVAIRKGYSGQLVYQTMIVIGGAADGHGEYTSDTSGTLRIVRKGQTVYPYYRADSGWHLLAGKAYGGFPASGGRPCVFVYGSAEVEQSCSFINYVHMESFEAIYPEHIVREIVSRSGKSSPKANPVEIASSGSRDRPNQVTVEFSRAFVGASITGIARADDLVDIGANGTVPATIRLAAIRRASAARYMANLNLMRAIAGQDTLAFQVGWKTTLTAGDLRWITYPECELDHVPIRIVSEQLTEHGTRQVTAVREEDIYDAGQYADDLPLYPERLKPAYPGDCENVRAILVAAEFSAPLDYDLDIFFTAPDNDSWAGAALYMAYAEEGDYVLKSTTQAGGILGVVAAVGDSGGTKYIDVTLYTDDDLASLTALASYFQNLAWIDCGDAAHWFQFTDVTLISGRTWRLTGLVWNTNSLATDNSYGDAAAADPVAFYARRPFILDIPDADLGAPLYFKVASVNTRNMIQSLADVDHITITISARNTVPSIGDYVEGNPAPLAGDAVHYESSDNRYYRANTLTRPNVVGVKDGMGKIILSGPGRKLRGLTPGSAYYLACPPIAEQDFYTGCDFEFSWTPSLSSPRSAQGFSLASAGKVITGIAMWMVKYGAPAYNVCLYLRADDGAGKPSQNILAKSEWLPGSDMPPIAAVNKRVYFRFFEFVELQPSTTYHISVEVDLPDTTSPVNWGNNYVKTYGDNEGFTSGKWHYHSAGGAWTEIASVDYAMALDLADVADTSAPNITTTHPFDTANFAPVIGMLPVRKVGLATSVSEMMVAVDWLWPAVVFSDWETTWSGDQMHNVATIDLLGAEKLLMLFCFWASTYGDNTEARAYCNGVAGTLFEYDNDIAPFQQMFRAQVFTKEDIQLGARKYLYIDLGAAGTPKAGRITVLKV